MIPEYIVYYLFNVYSCIAAVLGASTSVIATAIWWPQYDIFHLGAFTKHGIENHSAQVTSLAVWKNHILHRCLAMRSRTQHYAFINGQHLFRDDTIPTIIRSNYAPTRQGISGQTTALSVVRRQPESLLFSVACFVSALLLLVFVIAVIFIWRRQKEMKIKWTKISKATAERKIAYFKVKIKQCDDFINLIKKQMVVRAYFKVKINRCNDFIHYIKQQMETRAYLRGKINQCDDFIHYIKKQMVARAYLKGKINQCDDFIDYIKKHMVARAYLKGKINQSDDFIHDIKQLMGVRASETQLQLQGRKVLIGEETSLSSNKTEKTDEDYACKKKEQTFQSDDSNKSDENEVSVGKEALLPPKQPKNIDDDDASHNKEQTLQSDESNKNDKNEVSDGKETLLPPKQPKEIDEGDACKKKEQTLQSDDSNKNDENEFSDGKETLLPPKQPKEIDEDYACKKKEQILQSIDSNKNDEHDVSVGNETLVSPKQPNEIDEDYACKKKEQTLQRDDSNKNDEHDVSVGNETLVSPKQPNEIDEDYACKKKEQALQRDDPSKNDEYDISFGNKTPLPSKGAKKVDEDDACKNYTDEVVQEEALPSSSPLKDVVEDKEKKFKRKHRNRRKKDVRKRKDDSVKKCTTSLKKQNDNAQGSSPNRGKKSQLSQPPHENKKNSEARKTEIPSEKSSLNFIGSPKLCENKRESEIQNAENHAVTRPKQSTHVVGGTLSPLNRRATDPLTRLNNSNKDRTNELEGVLESKCTKRIESNKEKSKAVPLILKDEKSAKAILCSQGPNRANNSTGCQPRLTKHENQTMYKLHSKQFNKIATTCVEGASDSTIPPKKDYQNYPLLSASKTTSNYSLQSKLPKRASISSQVSVKYLEEESSQEPPPITDDNYPALGSITPCKTAYNLSANNAENSKVQNKKQSRALYECKPSQKNALQESEHRSRLEPPIYRTIDKQQYVISPNRGNNEKDSQAPTVRAKMDIICRPVKTFLEDKYPRWGGKANIPGYGQVSLINTCPVDGWIVIMHAIMAENQTIRNRLFQDDCRMFVEMETLYEKGQFDDLKLLIMNRNNIKPMFGRADFWQNEFLSYIKYFSMLYGNQQLSRCSSNTCPRRDRVMVSDECVSWLDPKVSLQETVLSWIQESGLSKCYESGSNIGAKYCNGDRELHKRVFDGGSNLPYVIPVETESMSDFGIKLPLNYVPKTLDILGRRYNLRAVTLFNKSHYTCIFRYTGCWLYYDGRQNNGFPRLMSTARPDINNGYNISYLFYE